MNKFFLFVFFILPTFLTAQVFTGTTGPIRNDSILATFNTSVSGVGIMRSAYGIRKVSLSIEHPAVQELHIYLKSPNGACVALSIKNSSGANYTNTVFDNNAATSIRDANVPFTGSFKPENSLAVFNTNNLTADGVWTLYILDDQKNNYSGILQSWSLEFGTSPALPKPFTAGSLPIFVINTSGKTIPTLNDINSKMYIINNSNGINSLSDTNSIAPLNIGIHIRGNSSAGGLKDPYSFSPVDKDGNDSNMKMLGMPSENDWILNNAFGDQSFMRDVLVYYLSNRMGRYASRTKFCELFINGDYRGLYCLMEKIKQDKNRVDISALKPTDTSGADVTGGYILKKDGAPGPKDSGFQMPGGFWYLYDDPDSPVIQQKQYIKAFMDTCVGSLDSAFSDTLYGYRRYIDYKSAIDYIILNEFGVSGDTYNRSTYWHKMKVTKGNKLYYGPAWDFNFGFLTSASPFKFPSVKPWSKIYNDTFFRKELWCKYNELRSTYLNPASINAVMDSFIEPVYEAIYRNDERWLQNKSGVAIIQNCYYKDACYFMKKFIYEHLTLLDKSLRDSCRIRSSCAPFLNYSINKTNICLNDTVVVSVNTTGGNVSIYPSTGVTPTEYYKFLIHPSLVTSYKLIWNTCSSIDTISLPITFNPKIIQCFGKDSLLDGDSALISVTGIGPFTWNPAVTTLNANGDSAYVKPSSTTTYTISGPANANCNSMVTKRITVVPIIDLKLFAPDSFCPGAKVKLKATGATDYKWRINGINYSLDSVLITSPIMDLDVELTGTNAFNQKQVITKKIRFLTPGQLVVFPTSAIFDGVMPPRITVTGGISYDWSPKYALDNYTRDTVYAFPNVNTLYTVNGLDSNGCVAKSATVFITVKKEGIAANKKDQGLAIYPNPMKNYFTVENKGVRQFMATIYNSISQKIMEFEIPLGEYVVNTENWPAGLYVMKVEGAVYKIVKE